jgi:uncharacterized protein
LAGRTAWLVTDGKMGMDVQVRGVADALGLISTMKHVAPTGAWRALSPYITVSPAERLCTEGTLFAPPFPDVILATGRLSIPYARALRKKAGFSTYCVVLQDPRTGLGIADLIWVPEHDKRRGANVVTTPTAPHSFSPERLAALRATMPTDIAALPGPRAAVVLGGPSGVYTFPDAAIADFARGIAALAATGVSLLVTPSRRTPPALLAAVRAAVGDRAAIIWDGTGENPYPQFLAHADLLVVTADSVNMTGEACATGRPVYVFEPSGGSEKFQRFHGNLRQAGATRSLMDAVAAGTVGRIEGWEYTPLDSAHVIARAVEERWSRRRQMLGGLGSSKAADG